MGSLRIGLPVLLAAWSCGTAAFAVDDPEFHWMDDPKTGQANLLFGEVPVIRYMYAHDTSSPEREHETYKVYHHVFGPGGGQMITKGPGGLYTHHRGLFLGWSNVRAGSERYDFWHCKNGVKLKHVRFREMQGGAESGTMTAEIHWTDPEGEPVISEQRAVTVSMFESKGDPTYGWQIDWSTTLTSHRGEIQLDGDRQHAGFQFRADNAVAQSKGARYIRPAGQPQEPAANQVGKGDTYVDAGWFALNYKLGERQYTVEYLDNPELPKPSRYSERPYGRFGTFFRTTLKPKAPLKMRYRVFVSSGAAPSQEEIQQRYEEWVSELGRGK